MYFLAGFAFLIAFTALAHGETCGEVVQCISHAQNVKSAVESGNIDAMCQMQKDMVDCFTSALADCESSGSSLPQETLKQFQTTMDEARKQYEKTCAGRGGSSSGGSGGSGGSTGGGDGGMTYGGSGGSIPEKASCMEASKCTFDVSKVQSALNENRVKDICAIVTPSAKCIKSAFNDCKEKKLLPEQQLKEMSVQSDQVNNILQEHCGAMGMSVSTFYITLISAFAFIVFRLF